MPLKVLVGALVLAGAGTVGSFFSAAGGAEVFVLVLAVFDCCAAAFLWSHILAFGAGAGAGFFCSDMCSMGLVVAKGLELSCL